MTITDTQIRALLVEAQTAGHDLQVAICKIALGTLTGHEACLDALADSEWDDADLRDPATVAAARAECERVIAEATP